MISIIENYTLLDLIDAKCKDGSYRIKDEDKRNKIKSAINSWWNNVNEHINYMIEMVSLERNILKLSAVGDAAVNITLSAATAGAGEFLKWLGKPSMTREELDILSTVWTAISEPISGFTPPIISYIKDNTHKDVKNKDELSDYYISETNSITNDWCTLVRLIKKEYANCEIEDKPCDSDYPTNSLSPSIDPSGYVYEGVPSNRIQGVIATAFYKEMVEDMYGDLHENIVKWDAEEYAQENPLFTDENGMYAWDVPQGLWQVKFEKEGYETTYSEWLPVPPPQLDVNIAMKQNRQPEVKAARAYEDAVEVEFDKYMMPELLTAENIMVMQNGTAVEGTVELLNEEVSYEGEAETFASKIRFNAAQPFTEQEITLMVNNRVRSYAGIRMQDNYQQTFTIEQEIKQIVSDSVVTVGYGNASTLVVSVLPASASKGKTLTVKTSSPMILGIETEQVIIGNDGKAEITVSGELPGTAALTFSVEGTDKTAMTIANVEQIVIKAVATPKASIASGTAVEKGTAITLTCETEGATIYYTLDGSCPCDNTNARKVYDGTPIIVNENMTIKAIAIVSNMYESEIAEFSFTINEINRIEEISLGDQIQIYPLPVRDKLNIKSDKNAIKRVTVSSLNGSNVMVSSNNMSKTITLDVSMIATGIYIINIQTEKGVYSRKITKID